MAEYRVEHLINSTYQVLDAEDTVLMQGDLCECNSYINLKEKGFLK